MIIILILLQFRDLFHRLSSDSACITLYLLDITSEFRIASAFVILDIRAGLNFWRRNFFLILAQPVYEM
jgi:hypothetical protein